MLCAEFFGRVIFSLVNSCSPDITITWIWHWIVAYGIFNTLFCLLLFSSAVYRVYTSILFHGSLLHVLFNMMALVPMGSELERIMGSIRLLYIIILLATSNAMLHLLIALLVAHNPFDAYPYLMDQCSIGFSGILFSMIVIETSLSGIQSRRFELMTAYLIAFCFPHHHLCYRASFRLLNLVKLYEKQWRANLVFLLSRKHGSSLTMDC